LPFWLRADVVDVQFSDRHGNPSETLSLSNSSAQSGRRKWWPRTKKRPIFAMLRSNALSRIFSGSKSSSMTATLFSTLSSRLATLFVEKEVCGSEFAMYKVFDKFLASDTWLKSDPFDEKRFYEALSQVVWFDAFNPDEMAAYMQIRNLRRRSPDLITHAPLEDLQQKLGR
jgi:hypothetical protein